MDHNKLNRILNKVAKSQLSERPDFAPIPYGLDEDGRCYARGTCCTKEMCGNYDCRDRRQYLGKREDGLDDAECHKLQLEEHRKMQSSCEDRVGPSDLHPCICSNEMVGVYTAQETCKNIASDDERWSEKGDAGCKRRTEGREPIFDVSILPEMCRYSDKRRRYLKCAYSNNPRFPDCDCENESFEDCALRLKDRCMQTIVHEQDKGMREKLICDCEREYLEALVAYYDELRWMHDYLSDIPECSICRELNAGYIQEYERYQAQLDALNVRCTTIFDDNPEEDDSDDPSGPRPPTGPTQPTRYP